MSLTSTIQFQHRFVGPKNRKLVPYARPAILGLWVDGVEQEHMIIRFGRATSKDECWIHVSSERDEEVDSFWSGTCEELTAMIHGQDLVIPCWSLRVAMSSHMAKILRLNVAQTPDC